MDRECNKCVYSTRDGNCRKWSCEGTKTVEDIKAEAYNNGWNEGWKQAKEDAENDLIGILGNDSIRKLHTCICSECSFENSCSDSKTCIRYCEGFLDKHIEAEHIEEVEASIKEKAKAEIIDRCKNLLNVTHFIEGYGDMIYALDLEIELGLIPTVEELKENDNG